MTVEGIGPVDPVSNFKRIDRTARPQRAENADSIDVSAEAKSAAEAYHAKELAMNSPDVRADRVAELKQKMQDPTYIDDTVLNSVADRLMETFGV